MTVTLPDTMRDELSLKARSAGFRDVDTYVAYLVVADDGDGVDEFADAEFTVPEELPLVAGADMAMLSR
ncbi:hypothetical protein BH11PLA2_BH11PLA2_08930 [soil metagenome]